MSFHPTIPLAGIAGWRFLERTAARQQAAFEQGPALRREIADFEARIGTITTAAELVADRKLLKVALGAFGLEGEIDKKAFLRRILEDGTTADDAIARRLTDPAFFRFAAAFGFGDAGPRTGDPGFATAITASYRTRAFEAAVGEASNDMRLALNFRREIAGLAAGDGGSWYSVLGSKPLRAVFETAFGLPAAFGQLDIDRQHAVLRDKAAALLGSDSLTAFKDPAAVDKLIDRFLARAQIEAGASATGPAATALTLLQGATGGASGLMNLIASQR